MFIHNWLKVFPNRDINQLSTWSLAVHRHSYSNTFLLLTRKGGKYHTKLTDKDLMLEFEMLRQQLLPISSSLINEWQGQHWKL